jgi:chromate reductase, NAD(P)H dehydrogenase (quinone)
LKYQIGIIVGSLRRASFNQQLANGLMKLAPPELEFRPIEIGDLPLYNQDHDAHPHPNVKRLKSEVAASHGLVFLTPEYNRSIPGILKNAIDHGSRPYGQSVWAGKPAGVMGISVGASGGAMAQQHLRNVLAYLDMPTLGQPEVFLKISEGLFDEAGNVTDAAVRKILKGWMDKYVAWVKRHTGQEADATPARQYARAGA